MRLQLMRFSSQKDSTNGILFDVTKGKRVFLCYTLEDERRSTKIMGETCIPEGIYTLSLKTVGGFHARYSKRFADIHKGMLYLNDVSGFSDILIHCGNTDEDTAGCILVGDTQNNNVVEKNGFIGRSTKAYMRVYPEIAKAIEKGSEVVIEVVAID